MAAGDAADLAVSDHESSAPSQPRGHVVGQHSMSQPDDQTQLIRVEERDADGEDYKTVNSSGFGLVVSNTNANHTNVITQPIYNYYYAGEFPASSIVTQPRPLSAIVESFRLRHPELYTEMAHYAKKTAVDLVGPRKEKQMEARLLDIQVQIYLSVHDELKKLQTDFNAQTPIEFTENEVKQENDLATSALSTSSTESGKVMRAYENIQLEVAFKSPDTVSRVLGFYTFVLKGVSDIDKDLPMHMELDRKLKPAEILAFAAPSGIKDIAALPSIDVTVGAGPKGANVTITGLQGATLRNNLLVVGRRG